MNYIYNKFVCSSVPHNENYVVFLCLAPKNELMTMKFLALVTVQEWSYVARVVMASARKVPTFPAESRLFLFTSRPDLS